MAIIVLQDDRGRVQKYHYEVESASRPLGSGGMGQVMRGVLVNEMTGSREEVAIKFLYDDLTANVIDRARKEASVQIHNENLIEMKGFMEIREDINGRQVMRYHVISELLRGVRLLDLLKGKCEDYEGKEIPFARQWLTEYQDNREAASITIVKNVLSGIMALHDAGYIHRDIDPSNVMVTDGKIKIIDLGLVKQMVQMPEQLQLTHAGQFMGKAAYAAPELVSGDVAHQNQTTDLYAIGILLYRLIVGELPFQGSNAEVINMQLQKKLPVKNIQNKQLRQIVERATEKRQNERYQSAAEFRADLERVDFSLAPSVEHTASANVTLLKDVAMWGGVVVGGGLLGALIRYLL